MKDNRWLLILGILGLIFLLFCPFMINVSSGGIFLSADFILSYGLFFEIYIGESFYHYLFFGQGSFNLLSYFPVSPIFTFIGILFILIAGFYYWRDKKGKVIHYSILTMIGTIFGIIGSFLFLPFGFQLKSNLFDLSEAISESFSWHFLCIYLSFIFFTGLGIWSIVRFIRYRRGPTLLTESELRLDTLKTARQNIKQIQEQYDDIPVHMLRQILNLNSEADLEALRQLLPPELQYTIVGDDVVFLKETVSKIVDPATLITAIRKDACFYCQTPISLDAEKCPNCGKPILDCAICKLPIKPGEEVAQCPKCEHIFHFKHLKTWVEFKMKCPTCLRELLPSEVQLDNPDK